MSELFDIQVNAQKEKNFRGSLKLPQAHEKVFDENDRNKAGRTQRTGGNDLNELRVNDS